MSNEIEVSIYDTVEVELTESGREIYIKHYKEILYKLGNTPCGDVRLFVKKMIDKVEETNICRLKYHDLMYIFGFSTVSDNKPPFKDGKFKIIKDDN